MLDQLSEIARNLPLAVGSIHLENLQMHLHEIVLVGLGNIEHREFCLAAA